MISREARLAIARSVWPDDFDHPYAAERLTGLVTDVLSGRESPWLTKSEIAAIQKEATKYEEEL